MQSFMNILQIASLMGNASTCSDLSQFVSTCSEQCDPWCPLPSSLSFSLKKKIDALRRRHEAQQETNNRHQCLSDSQTDEWQAPKPISVFPSHWLTAEERGNHSFQPWSALIQKGGARPSLDLLKEKKKQKSKNSDKPTPQTTLSQIFISKHQPVAHTPSFSLFSSPSTVKARLALLWQQASCISWHNESRAMWQLKATLARSQTARKRDTYSLDPFCPVTLIASLSSLCSRTSDEERPSLSDHQSPSLSQSGLSLGNRDLHMSPESQETN